VHHRSRQDAYVHLLVSVALSQATGIVVPQLFKGRPPRGNEYLTNCVIAKDLMDRLTQLISHSNVYIALPGSVGTLGEIVLVWNHISIDMRVNKTSKKHLILWSSPFKRFIDDTVRCLGLTDLDRENLHFVSDTQEAVALATRLWRE
jgi:predicted Rossmann-fold nucleotide-binding protein